jgi:hypothetical protein
MNPRKPWAGCVTWLFSCGEIKLWRDIGWFQSFSYVVRFLALVGYLAYLRQAIDYLSDGCSHDILGDIGFLYGIRQCLRLAEGSLAYFGLPCNSFSFLSRSQHCRAPTSPYGQPYFNFVQQGNILAARMCLLISLCISRNVRWMFENPDRSAVQFYPYLMHLMSFNELHLQRVFWSGSQLFMQLMCPIAALQKCELTCDPNQYMPNICM